MKWEQAREVAVRQVLSKTKSNTPEVVDRVIHRIGTAVTDPSIDLNSLIKLAKDQVQGAKREVGEMMGARR